jgi:transcriptional regulator with XRE-family HTH domain
MLFAIWIINPIDKLLKLFIMLIMEKSITAFGQLCKKYRIVMNLTTTEVGKSVGKTQSYISQVENGIIEPSYDFLQRSMDVYKLGLDERREFLRLALASSKKIEIDLNCLSTKQKWYLSTILLAGERIYTFPNEWRIIKKWFKDFVTGLGKEPNPPFIEVGGRPPYPSSSARM